MDEKEISDFLSVVSEELYPYWRMRSFRQERLKMLNENMSLRYPVELQMGTHLIAHLIPLSFTDKKQTIDLKKLIDQSLWLYPIGITEKNTFEDFNFDGLIFSPGTHLKPAYTQLFRTGVIEALGTIARADKLISLVQLQKDVAESLKQYLKALTVLNVQPPIYLFCKIVNGRDVKLSPQDIAKCGAEEKARSKALLRNDIEFPEIVISDLNVDLQQLLTPFFDICWNIFGYAAAPKCELNEQMKGA